MLSVGIRELKQDTSQLVRKVREEGVKISITYHGEVVALLVPVTQRQDPREPEAWVALDHLAAEIDARWPKGVSAVEAVSEDRE